jgi:Tfp pilus assembly protein PilF
MDLTEASKQFEQVLQIDKPSVTAMMGHAQIAEQQGEHEQALFWVEQACAANSKALSP